MSSETELTMNAVSPNTGWGKVRLSKLLVERRERSNGTAPVFSVSVHKGFVDQVEHLGRSYSASDTSHYSLVKPFDVVYTKSPTGEFPYGIVKQNLSGCEVIVSPLYGVFVPSTVNIGRYISAYFDSPARANMYLAPVAKKGAKNTIQISNDEFLSSFIPFPDDEAYINDLIRGIGSIDDVVDSLDAQLRAMRRYRSALMQRLVPRLDTL